MANLDFSFLFKEPEKDPDKMTVGELFGDCPQECGRLKSNGECPVCGWAPMAGDAEARRTWMKSHPQEEW